MSADSGVVALTPERLRDLLRYDPATGEFIRKTSAGRWKAGQVAGCKRPNGYLCVRVDGRLYLHHRLVWLYLHGEWPQKDVDHKNRDRALNTPDNLRVVTRSKNMANAGAHKDSFSKVKGVDWHGQRQKWRARIFVDGRERSLGLHETLEGAEAARRNAAALIHGAGYV